MLRKFWVLVSLVVLTNSFLIKPVMAEEVPATGGDVVVVARNYDGSTTVVASGEIDKDGIVNFTLPEGTDQLNLEMIATTGEGNVITTVIPASGETIVADTASTIANTLVGAMLSQFEDTIGFDIAPERKELLTEEFNKIYSALPIDEVSSLADALSVAADYSDLHPTELLEALDATGLPVPPEEALLATSLASRGIVPPEGDLDPLAKPSRMLKEGEAYPNTMAIGILPEGSLPPYMRGEEGRKKFEEIFGKGAARPGDLLVDIGPNDLTLSKPIYFNPNKEMPPEFQTLPFQEFTDNQKWPPDMSKIGWTSSAMLPEAVLAKMSEKMQGGPSEFMPKFPPNMAFAGDPQAFGFPIDTNFDPNAVNVKQPPGSSSGAGGQVFVPQGFSMGSNVKVNESLAFAMPQKYDFAGNQPTGGSSFNFPPPPANFPLDQMAGLPKTFPFGQDYPRPAGDQFAPLGFAKQDFTAFKGDFKPDLGGFFGGFDPSQTGPHVPPGQLANMGDQFVGMSPEAAKAAFSALTPEARDALMGGAFDHPAELPPPPQGGQGGANTGGQPSVGKPNNGGSGGFDGKGDNGPIANDGGANPAPTVPTGGTTTPSTGSSGGGSFVPPNNPQAPTTGTTSQPAGGTGTVAPPPPTSGTVAPPPPTSSAPPPPQQPTSSAPPPPPGGNSAPPPQRIKARSIKAKLAPYEAGTNKAGVRSTLEVATSAKAKRVTASKGVYLVGKAKASNTKAAITLIIDPSISSDSVKLSLSLIDKSVDTVTIDLEKDATELITQLDGKVIEMTTANSGVEDIVAETVTGYLLAPGTSTYKMQSAIAIKGTVLAGDSGDIVQFTLPARKLADGVYTITFQDGDNTYYGKVTIGTLKERKISCKIFAPKG